MQQKNFEACPIIFNISIALFILSTACNKYGRDVFKFVIHV